MGAWKQKKSDHKSEVQGLKEIEIEIKRKGAGEEKRTEDGAGDMHRNALNILKYRTT